MIRFVGTAYLNRHRLIGTRNDVMWMINSSAYTRITINGLYGICVMDCKKETSSNAGFLDNREYQMCYRIKEFTLNNFKKMLMETKWENYDFELRVNTKGHTYKEIMMNLGYDEILVRNSLSEDADEYFGYNTFYLNSLEDEEIDECYLHFSNEGNTCLYFGDYENPKYSRVLCDESKGEVLLSKIFDKLIGVGC